MTVDYNIGIAILAAFTVHSTVNAFVPNQNYAATIGHSFSTVGRRRSYSNEQRYSNNNIDENKNADSLLTPENTGSTQSASPDQIELLFRENSLMLDKIPVPPSGINSISLRSEDSPVANGQAIFAENAAILSATGDQTINLDFGLTDQSNTSPTRDSEEDVRMNEDLNAVLVASGEAAAAAEANMSPDLVEVLDELTIEPLDLTNLSSKIVEEIDGLSPEVGPKTSTETPPIIQINREPRMVKTSSQVDQELSLLSDDSEIHLFESANDNNDRQEAKISTPSVGKILKFAIPAIGVWLCGPILSMIDTAAVGILSGTTQQAALNPAVAVTDYAALLIAFLYTGTTNVVASAQESDRGTSDMPRTAKMMKGAMRMSTYVGAGLGLILFSFARPLLKGIIGNGGISPAVFAAAMRYVRIRALGMPAAAILGSTQAACLGMQDIKSPLYVLGAAALINLLGDFIFVGNSNPLIGGTAGAAWATVLSQYAAVAFFVRWLCRNANGDKSVKPPEIMNLSDAILEMTSDSTTKDVNGKNRRKSFRNTLENFKFKGWKTKTVRPIQPEGGKESRNTQMPGRLFALRRERNPVNGTIKSATSNSSSFSTRGFLRNRFSTSELLKLPEEETRKMFAPFVLPVTTTQVGRVSGYVAMAHVVASSLGMDSMAAQQIIVSIFYCLCPIADSLSLTAQSFVPTIFEREAGVEKAAAMKKVLINFLKAGAVFGGAMMSAVCGIPLLTGFFTSDQAVINLVNSVIPLLLVFFGVHGFVCGTEGMLLGQKDLGYLGKMYASFFAAVPYIMLGVKKKALSGSKSVGLTSVWKVFISYQLARCGLWLMRSVILQRRTHVEGKRASDNMNAHAP